MFSIFLFPHSRSSFRRHSKQISLMNCTADSVKKEIETQKSLTVKGDLQCPQSSIWIGSGNTPCQQRPASCQHVQKRTCKQRIRIDKQGMNLIVLTFYFTISSTDHRGFIDENDPQLGQLIDYGNNSGTYSINTTQFDKF